MISTELRCSIELRLVCYRTLACELPYDAQVEAMLDGDYAEHATRELRRRANANPDAPSSSDSDDDAATVEAASAETAPGDAHSWCVIS